LEFFRTQTPVRTCEGFVSVHNMQSLGIFKYKRFSQ
jgi:hypothetical protein